MTDQMQKKKRKKPRTNKQIPYAPGAVRSLCYPSSTAPKRVPFHALTQDEKGKMVVREICRPILRSSVLGPSPQMLALPSEPSTKTSIFSLPPVRDDKRQYHLSHPLIPLKPFHSMRVLLHLPHQFPTTASLHHRCSMTCVIVKR